MILLTSGSDLLQVVTGDAVTVDVHASWVDNAAGTITPGRTNTAISTAATTTVVGSPGASTQRNVQTLNVRNKHASSTCDVTIQHTDGSTAVELIKYVLAAGQQLQYIDGEGWKVIDASGQILQSPNQAPAGVVPIGGIINWSGTIAAISALTGWALCNGTDNAPGPDLRDRFIVGASQDDAGVAKTNIAGALSQTGGATGHSHSGHAALSHSGFSITDHTGLTHGLSIANHPDLTHAAIASHPALSLPGLTHADVSLPGYTHPVLTIEGMSHAVQSIASRNDLVAAALTHADLSMPSMSVVDAAIAGKASFASGTNRSGMTSVPTNSGTMAATTITRASHPTNSVTLPAWSISPASHPTFTASAPASHSTAVGTAASHPTFTADGLTHSAGANHAATDYGVHSITAPPAHGTAGTVTHSFTESSAHAVSAHDTVAQLPSYFALAFLQRMA